VAAAVDPVQRRRGHCRQPEKHAGRPRAGVSSHACRAAAAGCNAPRPAPPGAPRRLRPALRPALSSRSQHAYFSGRASAQRASAHHAGYGCAQRVRARWRARARDGSERCRAPVGVAPALSPSLSVQPQPPTGRGGGRQILAVGPALPPASVDVARLLWRACDVTRARARRSKRALRGRAHCCVHANTERCRVRVLPFVSSCHSADAAR
jgi:hypothetical protein